jgi:hypothetical protein
MRVDRTTYSVIVSWREGRAQICSLGETRFAAARQAWVDEGYQNLQTEWYVAQPDKPGAPDLFRVFAYWEGPDDAPSIEQLRRWGREAVQLPVDL